MYRIDLRAALYGDGRIGLRRIVRLVEHLPPGSATWIAAHGQVALWETTHELLALLIEVVHHQTRMIAKAFGGRDIGEPLRLPRPYEPTTPDEAQRVQRLESVEDVAGFLGLKRR